MRDQRLKLLVVDDDDLVIQSIRLALPEQWRVISANTRAEIPKETYDAAFVDMHLTKTLAHAEGVEIIGFLHGIDPHLEIVAISGDLDRDLMEGCLKAGASRFLAKPLSPEEILLTLEKIEALGLMRGATARGKSDSAVWVGNGTASREVLRQIAALKGENGPIYIEGESGTGKEVAASLINGHEAARPFITVNVAALPENLFESELFGHVRGAFTGADSNKMGLAEAAHNGDLFLDEIEALPLSQQPKLLRFLESGELRRVGAKEVIKVNVRVIAASNQNLAQMAKEGKFREDLLWRLNGKRIQLPSLRTRSEDIPLLAEYFLERERPRRNKTLSDDAKERLQRHPWPGNVRELRRVCEQLSLYSPLPIIRATDVIKIFPPTGEIPSSGEALDLSRGLNDLLLEHEGLILRQALTTGRGIDEIALLLKVSRSNLYKKIKEHNIEMTE